MPFIDVPNFNGTHTIDKDDMEKLPFNNKILMPNWATDISLRSSSEGVVSDSDVISQSILNILLTLQGERLFNLDFGTNIFAHLFENTNQTEPVKQKIVYALNRFEPRIDVKHKDITVTIDADAHSISIDLIYYIKLTREVNRWNETLYV